MGTDCRTNIFGLNLIEKHISQFNCIHFAAISIFMALVQIGRNLDYLAIFVLFLVEIGYSHSRTQERSNQKQWLAISNLGISFRGSLGKQLPETHYMISCPFSFRGSVRNHEFSDLNISFGNFRT